MAARRISLILGLLLYASVATGQEVPEQIQSDQATAFVDVNVIPMDHERILEHQTVIIRGDRIHEVGPVSQVKVPITATRIEGGGKFLLPGLADMHAHIMVKDELVLFVANGVTTIRIMWGDAEVLEWRERTISGALLGPRNIHRRANHRW